MAGTTPSTTNFAPNWIQQGPGNLWILGPGGLPTATPAGVIGDTATPQVTLDLTSGTPDATTYPLAVHLGATTGAIMPTVTPKVEDIKVDQADGPVARYLTEVELSLEAELAQLDPAIGQEAMPYGVYTTQASPGYKQLTFGGQGGLLPSVTVACIAPSRAMAGKFVVFVLFAAHGVVAFNPSIGRAKPAAWKAQFKGLTDLGRTAGRQAGVWYVTQ